MKGDLDQRTITRAWAADVSVPVQFTFDRAVRILRLFMAFSDGGSAGGTPLIRHVALEGGADYTRGEWAGDAANNTGDASMGASQAAWVTFSTAPQRTTSLPYSGQTVIHVSIPPDLIIQKGERLDVWVLGAVAPGAGATVASGPIVLTYLAVSPE